MHTELRPDDVALNVHAVLNVYEAAIFSGMAFRTDNPNNAHLVCSLCRRILAAEERVAELEKGGKK